MTENNARYNGKASFEEWRKEWALEDRYNFHTIEKKWQKIWDDEKAYKVEIDHDKEKFYALVEFPYPSGAGLHVGHPRSYTALDVIARKKRMQGFNVLYPMGFDAFGLPAENYAIKTGVHPAVSTQANIKTFTKQLKSLGFSFESAYVMNSPSKSVRLVPTASTALRCWLAFPRTGAAALTNSGLTYSSVLNINPTLCARLHAM